MRHASWDEIVQMPWILSPQISTLRTLEEELFAERGSSPLIRVEADNEAVMRSLVLAGGGIALMREDIALDAAANGEVALWNRVRLETTLKFLHLRQRQNDPEIRALLDVLHEIWLSAPAALREPA
jgi:DNA-binding transcriptional LysR family regulator